MSDTSLARLAGRHRQFLAFLTPRVGSRDQAEGILQAAFLKAVAKGASLRLEGSAVAWFYRLLRNTFVDHYRHQEAEHRALGRHAHDSTGEAGFDSDIERGACRCVLSVLDDVKPSRPHSCDVWTWRERPSATWPAHPGSRPVPRGCGFTGPAPPCGARYRLVCRTCATYRCFECTCGV